MKPMPAKTAMPIHTSFGTEAMSPRIMSTPIPKPAGEERRATLAPPSFHFSRYGDIVLFR
jgi:hypothetical protein